MKLGRAMALILAGIITTMRKSVNSLSMVDVMGTPTDSKHKQNVNRDATKVHYEKHAYVIYSDFLHL